MGSLLRLQSACAAAHTRPAAHACAAAHIIMPPPRKPKPPRGLRLQWGCFANTAGGARSLAEHNTSTAKQLFFLTLKPKGLRRREGGVHGNCRHAPLLLDDEKPPALQALRLRGLTKDKDADTTHTCMAHMTPSFVFGGGGDGVSRPQQQGTRTRPASPALPAPPTLEAQTR